MKLSQRTHWKFVRARVAHLGGTGSVYGGLDDLPKGRASDDVTDGCLVLEGGAFRGLYTAGVLDALMEAGINLSCTVGVSAGAMNGVNYVSGQIGRTGRINLKYRHDSRYMGVKAMKVNHGIIGFHFLIDELADSFDEVRFRDPARRFVAVATSLETGKPMYFEKGQCGDIMQAVRASASMPYVSAPVEVDGVPCLDGGCSDSIPLDWAMEQGYEKIIVVRTRPEAYRDEVSDKKSALVRRTFSAWPAFAETFAGSNRRYNRTCDALEQLKKDKKIIVISPTRPFSVHRLEGNLEKLAVLYEMGYQDAWTQMEEIRAYLQR